MEQFHDISYSWLINQYFSNFLFNIICQDQASKVHFYFQMANYKINRATDLFDKIFQYYDFVLFNLNPYSLNSFAYTCQILLAKVLLQIYFKV